MSERKYIGSRAQYVEDLEAQLTAVRGESARRAEQLDRALQRETALIIRLECYELVEYRTHSKEIL